jgi:hypothetical protein
MKLVKRGRHGFQYQLSSEEAYSLRLLIGQFPVSTPSPVKISKTDRSAAEREKLLNEPLAEHRHALKQKALDLASAERFKLMEGNVWLRIKPEERETMLQILNDLRVECWRTLGEPENPDIDILELPRDKIKYCHLMHLAGYFEHHFLNLEDDKE